ncbi:DUF1905 domain-containing protein [Terasakiella sp. A23]|uniref:DUF1905 domain-containing protein n=1 Tax=Terasakiella sp. FCG-A23 TaxID=3080561 RepID=UPI002955731D|nr:DUF1905 domain-containing protein [Terasakiella sp. A23]MDV7340716.1 DUF1905 domain-containing protein [Terasakiella sp. A23]
MIDLNFTFDAELWRWQSEKAAWYFVTLPVDDAAQISFTRERKAGFGSVRVSVTIGETVWKTSVFPSKESDSYLLPIKADVRKKEKIDAGDMVRVTVRVVD